MRGTRQRHTAAEQRIAAELAERGVEFVTDYRHVGIRSRPDIAVPSAHVVVFVDGCFWHGCPEHGTLPKTNTPWWLSKIRGNCERDERATATWSDAGWTVLRVWEHESAAAGADRIAGLIGIGDRAPPDVVVLPPSSGSSA
jgi:DNA mismatch endonuclease, patch repair protein